MNDMGAAERGVVVAIDASRNRSGGARAHLIGMLDALDPRAHGVARVHVWSYQSLLESLPDQPWLVRHAPSALTGSLLAQLCWQRWSLPQELRAQGCEVLLSSDAGTVCRFQPALVMSRDMLSFEPGELSRFFGSLAWWRLVALRFVQVDSLRRSTGALFLTEYAATVLKRSTGPLRQVRVIPHGVSDAFRQPTAHRRWPPEGDPVTCLYVSNADLYKHQWHVVEAIASLRARGLNLRLRLVGSMEGPAGERLRETLARLDPNGEFVTSPGPVPHAGLPGELARADLFIFASSCENMPNTLVEAMAAGLPIACSDRGPMPEVLGTDGVYFDPESPATIAIAVEQLVRDESLRTRVATGARERAAQFSWVRTARETWDYLVDIARPNCADPRSFWLLGAFACFFPVFT